MNDATQPSALLTEARDGAVAILTMNYPARRNALSVPMRVEMIAALERIEADDTVRAIVLTGAEGIFSSGGDISGMQVNTVAAGRTRFINTVRLIKLLVGGQKPIIAAVEGWAAGAGLSIALTCDTVVAAEDARFICSFNKIGLMPDLGMLHTLPARVGQGKARQIMLYGEAFDARQAAEWGIVDHVVPKGQALAKALERAHRFDNAAPTPLSLVRRFLSRGLDEAMELERDLQTMLFLTEDFEEGKQAFLGKRAPQFKGV